MNEHQQHTAEHLVTKFVLELLRRWSCCVRGGEVLAFNRIFCLEPLDAAASINITIAAKCDNSSFQVRSCRVCHRCLHDARPLCRSCRTSHRRLSGFSNRTRMQKTNTLLCKSLLLCLKKTHTVAHSVHKQTHPQGNHVTKFVCDVRE